MLSNRIRFLSSVFIVYWYLCSGSVHASTYELDQGDWKLIAIPALLPSDMNTPDALFGDEFSAADPLSLYERDWVMIAFDSQVQKYRTIGADEPLKIDSGYWIIQEVVSDITLKLPAGAIWAGTNYQCPVEFAHYALTAANPASWVDTPQYDSNSDDSGCIVDYAPNYDNGVNDDPSYTLSLSDPSVYGSSQPLSWGVNIETHDGRTLTLRSDDSNPPTRDELNACSLIVRSGSACRFFYDPDDL